VGTPNEVYESPRSRFVLNFLGFSNFLAVSDVEPGDGVTRCRVAGRIIRVSTPSLRQEGGRVVELAIRPERLRVGEPTVDSELPNFVPGTVDDVTYEGALIAYGIVLEDGQRLLVREQNQGAMPERPARRPGG